jgi:zinc transporter ZupT
MNGRRRWIEAMAGGVNFRGSFLLIITQRLAAHTHTHTHTHTHWLIYFDSCNTHKKEKKKKKRVIII